MAVWRKGQCGNPRALRCQPHHLNQVVDLAGRDAIDLGFLDHRGERLLRHALRLKKAREVVALPEQGMRSSTAPARVPPVKLAIAVALRQTLRALLAKAGAGQAADLQFHQTRAAKPIISRRLIGGWPIVSMACRMPRGVGPDRHHETLMPRRPS